MTSETFLVILKRHSVSLCNGFMTLHLLVWFFHPPLFSLYINLIFQMHSVKMYKIFLKLFRNKWLNKKPMWQKKKWSYTDILDIWIAQSKKRSVLFTFLPKNNRNEGQQWQRSTTKKNTLHWEMWLYILLRSIDDPFRNTSIFLDF